MAKPTITCPACGKDMRLEDSCCWELEHEPLRLSDKVPRSVTVRKKWIYICNNCKTRVEYVELIARYKLDESSIKRF